MPEVKELDLGREALGGTAAKVVMALAGFVGTIVFARVLGPTTYGGVGVIITLMRIVDKPIAGWGTAGKKRISEEVADTGEILGAQIVVNATWVVLIGIVAFVFSGWLVSYTGLGRAPVFLVVLLASVATFSTFQSLLKGHGRVSLATWIDTVRSYVTLPLQIGLILLGWGAAGMVYGLAAASAAMIPITLYYLNARPALPTSEQLRSLWEFARYSIPSTAFNLVYNRLDILILATLLSPSAVGYYDVAWKLTLPTMFVAQAAGSALMSKLSSLDAAGEATNTDLVNTLAFTSVFAVPAFVGAVLLHRELVVTIFGPEYEPAWGLLIGLAAYRVVATQSGPMINALNGLNRPDLTMWITGTTVAGNVLVGIALTIVYGPIGAVVATFLAETGRYVAAIAVLRNELPAFPLVPRPLIEQGIAALVMGGVIAGLRPFITVASWVDLAVLVGTGAVVYSGVVLVISAQLRHTVQSALRGFGVPLSRFHR